MRNSHLQLALILHGMQQEFVLYHNVLLIQRLTIFVVHHRHLALITARQAISVYVHLLFDVQF